MDELVKKLFPLCRSITGDGVRATLKILGRRIPLEVVEVPTGTKAFDWVVPQEWNIKDAYVLDPAGKKIIDFKKNNLHLVGYSVPVDKTTDKLAPSSQKDNIEVKEKQIVKDMFGMYCIDCNHDGGDPYTTIKL